jgi:hypothetical protein
MATVRKFTTQERKTTYILEFMVVVCTSMIPSLCSTGWINSYLGLKQPREKFKTSFCVQGSLRTKNCKTFWTIWSYFTLEVFFVVSTSVVLFSWFSNVFCSLRRTIYPSLSYIKMASDPLISYYNGNHSYLLFLFHFWINIIFILIWFPRSARIRLKHRCGLHASVHWYLQESTDPNPNTRTTCAVVPSLLM